MQIWNCTLQLSTITVLHQSKSFGFDSLVLQGDTKLKIKKVCRFFTEYFLYFANIQIYPYIHIVQQD